jgi:hexosaminidase
MQDVITEVMSIFPSSYIHIGGDEVGTQHWKNCVRCQQRMKDNHLKNEKELQSYAIKE